MSAMTRNQSIPTIMVADSDDDSRNLLKSLHELKGFYISKQAMVKRQ